jgi:hypothetical protein
MAGFQDVISQFNPYIQQLPVEAMTQVGMYKQQKYDEGVQKIQSYIDNVAGMDVVRDIDKAYLQSKLNELGSKLKTVAAGDFSNYQLVNSVGGMATQIAKDPNVQNAVMSASKYRKETQRMQKDIDEGKSSPANIFQFQKRANQWTSSTKLDESFNASYNSFFDVDKFTKETFDAVKPDGYTFEQIFETDANGKILRQQVKDPNTGKIVDGPPIYSPVMTRLEQEGRFPKTVRNTIEQIFSDPRVGQQLQITGEYNYRDYSGDTLKQSLQNSFDKRLAIYDAELVDLNLKKMSGQDVQADIDKLATAINKAKASYQQSLQAADENPDAIRGMLHKDDVYDNYTSMYGTMKEKRTTEENPAWNQMFKQQQEANANARHAASLGLQYKQLQQADNHFRQDLAYKMLDLRSKLAPDAGTPPVLGQVKSDISFISIEQESFDKAALEFSSAVSDFVLSTGVFTDKINQTIQNSGGKMTQKAALAKIIESNSKKLNMTPEQYTKWMYDKASIHISNSGNATSNVRAAQVSAQNALTKFRTISETRTEIDKLAPNPMVDVIRGMSTQRIDINGTSRELTPQDQYDIAIAYAGSDWYESSEVKAEAKAAQARLLKRGFSESDISGLVSDVKLAKSDYSPFAPSKANVLLSMAKLIDVVDTKENVASLKDRAEAIKSFYQLNPSLEKNIITGKEETDKRRRAELMSMVGRYQQLNQNLSPDFVENAANIAEIVTTGKGGMTLRGEKNEVTGDIVPKVVFTGTDGQVAGEMTISLAEASTLGQDLTQWWKDPSYQRALNRMGSTGNGTTSNSGKVNDVQTYKLDDVYYFKQNFRNLSGVKDDVKGNISSQPYMDANGNFTTLYYGHIYVNNNGVTYLKTLETPATSIDEIIQKFDGLTPQMVEALKSDPKNRK